MGLDLQTLIWEYRAGYITLLEVVKDLRKVRTIRPKLAGE
jgi:hypothetical protein